MSNSKYVQTNFGIYQLKFFFVDGYTTEDGEDMSVREIRKIMKECIDSEDQKKPVSYTHLRCQQRFVSVEEEGTLQVDYCLHGSHQRILTLFDSCLLYTSTFTF